MKKHFTFFAAALSIAALLSIAAPAFAFIDVPASSDSATAIAWLTDQGVIQGYSDGTYQPDREVNRAEFLKILLALAATSTQSPSAPCFSDVPTSAWYAPYVCAAKTAQIIQGYSDGTFKPEQSITVVEASKIIALALSTPLKTAPGTQWYSPYLETLGDLNVYPQTLSALTENVTRGELAEMLWRLQTHTTSQPATAWQDFALTCIDFTLDAPPNANLDTIKNTWLTWTNETRAQQGLAPYTENQDLDRSATVWSQTSKARGYMDHKRPGTTAYYDYYAIEDWFANLGLTFENDGGYTFTENIGHGPYACSASDCTTDLLEAIRYTYEYYLSEQGSSYSPHWNSLVSPAFTQIGIGLTVDDSSYYLTVHYATKITSQPMPVCD